MQSSIEQDILIKFQREINSLSDPDRHIRLRGLSNLYKELYNIRAYREGEVSTLIKIFECQISRFMNSLINDSVERIRETSLKLMWNYIEILCLGREDAQQLTKIDYEVIRSIMRSILKRINVVPFAESTEEIRLQIIKLVERMVKRLETECVQLVGEVVSSVSRVLADQFPEVKKAGAELIMVMSLNGTIADLMGLNCQPLLKQLVLNLAHQHSKVRALSLKAIFQVLTLSNAGDKLELIQADLKKIIFNDHSSEVKLQGYQGLYSLLLSFNNSLLAKYESYLVSLLLYGLSDSLFTQQIQQYIETAGHQRKIYAIQTNTLPL